MTRWFYEVGTVWQTLLLVLSQGTMIALAAGTVMLFMHHCRPGKTLTLGGAFLVNAVLQVLMLLDSRITGAAPGLNLHLPYGAALAVTLLLAVLCVWMMLSETKNRRTINQSSIKEAFDNLPAGVCFFNEAGLPVLCNHAMQRFSFAVCGKDVQFITDLEDCLCDGFVPAKGVQKDGKVFALTDGRAWRLERRSVTHENGECYTQYVATDVSQLQEKSVELRQENARLRSVQAQLQRLSANVVAATREEEILNTKMRVHDEMGKCLVAAQKYLKTGCAEPIPETVVAAWRRAVALIRYSDPREEDLLLQIRKTCEYVKLRYVQSGELTKQETAAYLLSCAVRECVTNAVRYAEATELYVTFTETETEAAVTVTNNGRIPEGDIVEGGGLSTLRRRIERSGGTMVVRSQPRFALTVTVPLRKEGTL